MFDSQTEYDNNYDDDQDEDKLSQIMIMKIILIVAGDCWTIMMEKMVVIMTML